MTAHWEDDLPTEARIPFVPLFFPKAHWLW